MRKLVMQIEDTDAQIHKREQAAKKPLEPKKNSKRAILPGTGSKRARRYLQRHPQVRQWIY